MTDRQIGECLRLLTEVQAALRGHHRLYNRLSSVKTVLIRERRRQMKAKIKTTTK